MKFEKSYKVILRPVLVGLVAIILGIVLVVYYNSQENATTASYFISWAVVAVGIFMLLFALYVSIMQIVKNRVSKFGTQYIARYLSHETNSSAGKVNYYSITYTYHMDGMDYTKTSKEEFTWKEILTLKTVKEFKIKVFNNKVILDEDLNDTYIKYQKQIAETESKYNNAYREVEDTLKKNK